METEQTNHAALRLYESLGFAKVKRMQNYYMSGNDAFRLKLFFVDPQDPHQKSEWVKILFFYVNLMRVKYNHKREVESVIFFQSS